jgi:hypothetical protein
MITQGGATPTVERPGTVIGEDLSDVKTSSSARNNFSGAIDGRPVLAYKRLNRALNCCSASSVRPLHS